MQENHAYEIAQRHHWERHGWIFEDWRMVAADQNEFAADAADQDDESLADPVASPSEIYDIDRPMKVSTAAGSLW